MSPEQAMKYIGQPWSEDRDCYYWFREIQRNEFGRDLPLLVGDHRVFRAAKLLKSEPMVIGAVCTTTPREGDAVFLSQKNRPHHLGVLVNIDGRLQVLHALEGSGVILSDELSLGHNGWRIDGYWTDRPD